MTKKVKKWKKGGSLSWRILHISTVNRKVLSKIYKKKSCPISLFHKKKGPFFKKNVFSAFFFALFLKNRVFVKIYKKIYKKFMKKNEKKVKNVKIVRGPLFPTPKFTWEISQNFPKPVFMTPNFAFFKKIIKFIKIYKKFIKIKFIEIYKNL